MNGKVYKKVFVNEPTFDNDGNPIYGTEQWEDPIPCKYVAASRNDVYDIGDGTFLQASFIITIKDLQFNASHIKLENSRGELVCSKDIKSLEVLENIRRVKLII